MEKISAQTERCRNITHKLLGFARDSGPTKREFDIHEVLVEARSSITPEQAFEKAGFTEDSVEEFYEELRGVVKKGIVRELRPNDTEVYLEAVAQ